MYDWIITCVHYLGTSGYDTIFVILYTHISVDYFRNYILYQIFMRWNIKLRKSIISGTFSGEVMHWLGIDNMEPFQSAFASFLFKSVVPLPAQFINIAMIIQE